MLFLLSNDCDAQEIKEDDIKDDVIESMLKCISDGDPDVRKCSRSLFFEIQRVWPSEGIQAYSRMSPSNQRAVKREERSKLRGRRDSRRYDSRSLSRSSSQSRSRMSERESDSTVIRPNTAASLIEEFGMATPAKKKSTLHRASSSAQLQQKYRTLPRSFNRNSKSQASLSGMQYGGGSSFSPSFDSSSARLSESSSLSFVNDGDMETPVRQNRSESEVGSMTKKKSAAVWIVH
mmetsp:Transcript_2798/g.3848  ORF Transcript_2798/g.3848 Transcript_2798/m.3848 type:complete len:234 (+) Transcript_2798:58-759(+)